MLINHNIPKAATFKKKLTQITNRIIRQFNSANLKGYY